MVSSMGMGGDDIRPDNSDFVLWAMDQGLNYFDTAPQYGNGASERGYAAILKARGRDKVFQVTKANVFPNRTRVYQSIFRSLPEAEQTALRNRATEEIQRRGTENPEYLGNYFTGQAGGLRATVISNFLAEKYRDKIDNQKEYKQYILNSVERSLKALETDYVDCILMRGVETPYEVNNTPEVFEAFEILKKQGKARFLGFSAHTDCAGHSGRGHRYGRLLHGDDRLPFPEPQVGGARSGESEEGRLRRDGDESEPRDSEPVQPATDDSGAGQAAGEYGSRKHDGHSRRASTGLCRTRI